MSNQQKPQKRTLKQTAALVCVILIAVMILATLLTAFLDSTGMWFRSCLILTIAVPILAWVCIWLYGLTAQKHSIASVDLLSSDSAPSDAPAQPDSLSGDTPDAPAQPDSLTCGPEDSCDK